MLFSALSKLLASLLVVVLTGAVFTMVLNQTVLNNLYIEDKLAETDSYNRLYAALNDEIAKKAGKDNAEVATITAKLQGIITPDVLKTKINGALDQMHDYYRGEGPAPTIDLTDLVAQAQSAGIPIPEDSGITKPIKLETSDQAKGFSKTFDGVRTGTLVTALVLVAALLLVSWERHKWAALPDVLIVVGVLLGLLAAIFGFASGMADDYIKFDTSGNAFAELGKDLVQTIAGDLAKRMGIIAAVFGVVGIGTRIWVARMHPHLVTGTAPIATAKLPKKPATPTFVK